jgi:tRNA pseudouridine38-40 synthase
LNAHLPGEIRILRISRASPNFHARFQARGKIYLYRIWNGPVLPPVERGRAWHLPAPLDLQTLRRCAQMLEGTHDFAGFAANRRERQTRRSSSPPSSSVRTVRCIGLQRRGALLTLRFAADGFLYKMVRLMTGTLVRCAQGRMPPETIRELLTHQGARKTSFAAPPDGLYLVRVLY